ncbi:MAG: hypothetical protein F7C38_05555 [Desulfurococcales archaeon]|nr:hypothetical protein [Desulfurococcales archaeon]
MASEVLDKIVIIGGTTGIGLKRLYNCLKTRKFDVGDACVFHFESMLEEEYSRPGRCGDIEQLIALTLTSRPAALKAFSRGIERIRARIAERGCNKAVVVAHLTYLSKRSIIANPALVDLLRMAREASIIYMTDDHFDALYRMALSASDRVVSGSGSCAGLPETPYHIDPVLYLTWRAVDSNILSLAVEIKPGTETYIFGVKHPARDFQLLLKRVLKTRREFMVDSTPVTAYLSHPITQVRAMYVALGDRPLSELSLVKSIEALKEALRRAKDDIVIYEPTTVDELHQDRYSRIREIVPRDLVEKTVLGGSLGVEEVEGDPPLIHSLFVDSMNRWPYSEVNLREYCAGQPVYPYREGGRLSILDPLMAVIYGDDMYSNLLVDVVVHNMAKPGPTSGAMRGMLMTQLLDLVNAQIEERDYAYVSQSDHIIAATTAVVVSEKDAREMGIEPGIYIPWSTGMDAEIQRARALAKPITYYLLPLCSDTLLEATTSRDEARRLGETLTAGFKQCNANTTASTCGDEEAIEAVRRCAVRIQRGGLFATIGGGVRVCVLPVLYRKGVEYEELVEAYSKSLC